ncbi:ABC transporter ATP-binding protein [Clostridium sp.]|uniref:ABC transporter ATP-binding protein n=1 Tax=Clostridium sp. TaxID=1506 RepID=UPI002634CC4D|nr:ABC transporter ATP-binding protein [Clostridium sp.]
MDHIEIKDLSFAYPNSEKNVLDKINVNINEGDFILLIGESGCGKSTLLRHLKNEIAPHGKLEGDILYKGKSIKRLEQRESASEIGFVMQNPDYQIVTDKVWHELAFGLESLGIDSQTIRRRVAEMASFFGIQTWFRKDVSELSGGQKQLLNLASIMVMQPKVLILDEPTSQLDPIAATEFLETICKINRELGVTVIITEHRLEEVFSMADKIILMDSGKIIGYKSPKEIGNIIYNKDNKHSMFYSLPTPIRIYKSCNCIGESPLTIKESRDWVKKIFNDENKFYEEVSIDLIDNENRKEPIIELRDVWFRYEKSSPDILRGLNLNVYKNEILSILGGNGTGKTTTLGVISGNNKPYRGNVYINKKKIEKYKLSELFNKNLAVLPQDPQSLFIKSTLQDDLEEVFDRIKLSKDEKINKVQEVSELLGIKDLLKSHPYDLSGGEQQKAALAKILLLEPKILILDEPTKGLDGNFKKELGDIIRSLKEKDVTIVIVTHDIEFAAEISDRCLMFFDGDISSEGTPREFFCGNSFYTTCANKISRGILKDILKVEDMVDLWKFQNLRS